MYLGNLFFNFLKQDLFSLYILITSLSALNTGYPNCLATKLFTGSDIS